MVGATGFEPATSCSQSKRSSQAELRSEPRKHWQILRFGIPQVAFSILPFYTIRMNTDSSNDKNVRWQKTPVANLVRHVQSGNYYARIRVRGKLIWKSLKTDRISVAKLRLGDFHKEERKRASVQTAVARVEMTLGDALEVFKQRFQDDPEMKPKTKEYYQWRIAALLCHRSLEKGPPRVEIGPFSSDR